MNFTNDSRKYFKVFLSSLIGWAFICLACMATMFKYSENLFAMAIVFFMALLGMLFLNIAEEHWELYKISRSR